MYSYWYAGQQNHACLLWPDKAAITLRVTLSSLISHSSSFISVPWFPPSSIPLGGSFDPGRRTGASSTFLKKTVSTAEGALCCWRGGKALTRHKPRHYWYKLRSMYVPFFSFSSLFSYIVIVFSQPHIITVTFVLYIDAIPLFTHLKYSLIIARAHCLRMHFFFPLLLREWECILTQATQGRGLNISFKAALTKLATCLYQVKRENISLAASCICWWNQECLMLQFGMIYLQIMLTSHANVRTSVIVNNFFFFFAFHSRAFWP